MGFSEAVIRFPFGNNWKSYVEKVGQVEVQNAQESLADLIGTENIRGKTFLDIGCGSGIHSAAALKLGAKSVIAVDLDENSTNTTKEVLKSFSPEESWEVVNDSIFGLEPSYKAEIVYSWGVLHHTGHLFASLEKILKLVATDGQLVISVYKKTPMCSQWKKIKSFFCRSGKATQFVLSLSFSAFYLLGVLLSGRNPVKYVREYYKQRGQSWSTDIIDWIGGYPYESASPDEIIDFVTKRGFTLKKLRNAESPQAYGLFGTGCAEFIFKKL